MPAVTTILLARHGETDWNREGRFQGHADPPLNDTGRAQAAESRRRARGRRARGRLLEPAATRARDRASAWRRPHGLAPVAVDALREVDVGSWQGLTRAEIEARFPEQFARWLDYGQGWEDGESYEEMGRRVVAALLELAAAHDGERILVVTHGGPIRAAFAFADGTSHADARRLGPTIGNVFLAEFAVEDGALRRLD